MTDIKNLERTLWTAADKLRSNMDAAEYKHVVLGLIFLKYISDAFNGRYEQLKLELENEESEWYVAEEAARYQALNDRDEYTSHNIFYVPERARWAYLQAKAKQPEIGKLVDDAMDEIEKINPSLKGVLPKIYADPDLNKQRLGELIDLIGTIASISRATRPRTCWAGCTNTSWASLLMQKAKAAASSIRRLLL